LSLLRSDSEDFSLVGTPSRAGIRPVVHPTTQAGPTFLRYGVMAGDREVCRRLGDTLAAVKDVTGSGAF